MDVLSIPFNHYLGLELSNDPEYLMELPAKSEFENHLQTVHASALFALAEASSGLFLLREFAEVDGAIPVVRNVEVKYKKPGRGTIFSKAKLSMDKTEVLETLRNKHRALIPVDVSLYDSQSVLLVQATFEWFVLINKE